MTTSTEMPRLQEARAPHLTHKILSPGVVSFIEQLDLTFEAERLNLLNRRKSRQAEFDKGHLPDFLPDTKAYATRTGPLRRFSKNSKTGGEITGPTDRKMIINALNSGAKVFMADFEDSTMPTWTNCIEGQQNLYDANCREISFTSPEGKQYRLNENPAVLFVRPRGLHMAEKHWVVQSVLSPLPFSILACTSSITIER